MRAALLLGLASLPLVLAVREARAELLFEDQGQGKLGTQPCGGSGCWTNYARITDVEGDGDLDLVAVNCGGFFQQNTPEPQPLTIYANDGAGSFTNASSLIASFTGCVRQVAFGDIDNDGDVDMYVPAAAEEQQDALFVANGGTFANEAGTRLPAGLTSDAGATRFGDFDNDGDLDLIVANGYFDGTADPAALYYNDGAGVFTAAPAGAVPTAHSGTHPDDIDLADVDGDFDLDVYINMHSGQNSLWLNDGDGTFTDASATLPPLGSGSNYHYGPVFCDVDNDGDRDLLIDNTGGSYREQLLINGGSGNFTDQTNKISGNPSGADDNIVSCLDVDQDGDFDISIGALPYGSNGAERLFKNDGSGNFTMESGAFTTVGDSTLWMEFGDLNGDGRLDVFTAQGEGQELERVYFGNMAVPADTAPPQIVATDMTTVGSDTVIRFAVRDNAVTDEGPRLRRAFLFVDGMEVPARYMGGDLYRAVLPANAAMFTACAEDQAGNVTADCGGSNPTTTSSSASSTTGSGPGATTGASTTGSGAGTGSGGGGADGADGGEGDGCDCSTTGGANRSAGALFGVAGAALAIARLRRRRATGGQS